MPYIYISQHPVRLAVEPEYWQESATGQGAATIYRDAQGLKVDLEELRRLQEAEQAAKKKPKAEPPEWGKGIKQVCLLPLLLLLLLLCSMRGRAGPLLAQSRLLKQSRWLCQAAYG